jgi:hypothetical protein
MRCKDLGDLRARLLELVGSAKAHDLVFIEERGHQRRDQPGIVDRISGERVGSTLRPPITSLEQLADGHLASDGRRWRPAATSYRKVWWLRPRPAPARSPGPERWRARSRRSRCRLRRFWSQPWQRRRVGS